jgi:hypothetical protein
MQRHVPSFVSAAVATCAAFTIIACSPKSNSATSPSQTGAINGTWSGASTDAILGGGTLSLNLNQYGDSVNGTWSSTYPNPNNNLVGTVLGTVGGSTLTLLLKPLGAPTCQYGPFELTATVTGTGSMSGKLTEAYPCTVSDSGSFSGTKQ